MITSRVVRRHEHTSMPWRNGGGTTFEIARAERAGADFDWRLSLALIERSGPFSDFEGYQRAIALVSGAGCLLHGIHATPVRLAFAGATALFPGAAAVQCELIDGSCCDLNLMVREPGGIVAATYLQLTGDELLTLAAGHQYAVFCLDGVMQCADAGVALATHDTLLISATAAAGWNIRPGSPGGANVLAYAWRVEP